MGYWNTRGRRGDTFEQLLNLTNEYYLSKGLALVQKIPTPITPIKRDEKGGTITLAYFDKKSTVDYIGVVQGVPICFDAKETELTSLPFKKIHEHQVEFMRNFHEQKGVAFLLVNFAKHNRCFFLHFTELYERYQIAQNGGRKSIPFDAFDERYEVFQKGGAFIHYLKALEVFLSS